VLTLFINLYLWVTNVMQNSLMPNIFYKKLGKLIIVKFPIRIPCYLIRSCMSRFLALSSVLRAQCSALCALRSVLCALCLVFCALRSVLYSWSWSQCNFYRPIAPSIFILFLLPGRPPLWWNIPSCRLPYP